MKTRLKDVAKHLNLSPALVSGVLNNRPKVWASAETRSRIVEAARTLNYHPSAAAQALGRGTTSTVGFVYRRLEGSDFRLAYTGLVDVFSAMLQKEGFDLIVSNFASQEEVLAHLEKLARSRSVDAMILWGREQDTEVQGKLLESLGIPFLIKGRFEDRHPHWRQVDFDHEWMMDQAVLHLASQGRTRLAYLGFSLEDSFARALRRGFETSFERTLGRKPTLIAECQDEVGPNEEVIDRWLQLPDSERPDGFVIGAGNCAWSALEICLAKRGRCLGQSPESPGAAGIVSHSFSLMFGNALVYHGIELDNLAEEVSPMLTDMLTGVDPEPEIFRMRPPLTIAPTLNLFDRGVVLPTSGAGDPG